MPIVDEELNQLLRLQRHDFLNHLQVIHAMVQLGKGDRAISYIEELAREPRALVTEEVEQRAVELSGRLQSKNAP